MNQAADQDVSPPLASLPDSRTPGPAELGPESDRSEVDADAPVQEGEDDSAEEEREKNMPPSRVAPGGIDPVVQRNPLRSPLSARAPLSVTTSFEGIASNGYAPPDTSMDVSPTQIVEVVNTRIAVYSKSGTALYGPASTNTLWSGFGGLCQTTNDGDATAQWDRLANRWVISQFAVSGADGTTGNEYLQCVAVSQTSDATGAWYRYSFKYTSFPDFPKLAVWPDAYYTTFNMFAGNSWNGALVCAYDRASMLTGAAATQQCFQPSYFYDSLLVAGVEGSAGPSLGTDAYAVAIDSSTALAVWRIHIDWATPANSSLTQTSNAAVATFSIPCGGSRTCIPQPGVGDTLDVVEGRLMYRFVYHRIGSTQSFLVSSSVGTTPTGVRWYELRPAGNTLAVYQQGTYSPDSTNRWMPSIAMDDVGNIAVEYNASSSSVYPSIRFAGRLFDDPLGTLPQGETTLVAGTGSQIGTSNRWGDYSAIALDPDDGCTFWMANQYIAANGSFNWKTRIGSFSFPNCSSTGTPPSATITSPASPTNASTLTYSIDFNRSVTGLTASDFTVTGTATGCTVGTPTGSGSSYDVALTGCSNGTVILTLVASAVVDGDSNIGPFTAVVATTVIVDNTALVCASSSYSWIDPTGGDYLSVGDEYRSPVTLPFAFSFYGGSYSTAVVSPNGLLRFGTDDGSADYSNQAIPTIATPNNFIAFAWDDWDPSSGGWVMSTTVGSAPNRVWALTFLDIRAWVSISTRSGPARFQLVLEEATGAIRMQYQSMNVGVAGRNYGASATVGVEDAAGLRGAQVSYNVGTITDATAYTCNVPVAPAVTTQPTAQTVDAGQSVSFTAAASGFPAPAVQWQVSTDSGGTWSDINGANSATYTFTAAASDHNKRYHAVFSNNGGTVTSTAVKLSVNVAPTVTTQPSDQTVTTGTTATFMATGSGNPSPTVKWQVSTDSGASWNDIGGATLPTYSFTTAAGDHNKRFHAVFTNSVGSATSNDVTLTVNLPPGMVSQPSNSTTVAGQTASFTASASGRPTPTVQWQVSTNSGGSWNDISGAQSATYSFTATLADQNKQYRAVFTNSLNSVTSTAATLTVLPVPTITSFTPTSGRVGTALTLTGSNFSVGAVCKLNAVTTPCTVLNSSTIVTSVPPGASTGRFTVSVAPATGTSASSFTVLAGSAAPLVTGFTPTFGAAGAVVTITGSNLAGATSITFGTFTVTNGWSVLAAGRLSIPVPSGAVTGRINVTTAGGSSTSYGQFVRILTPVITALSPASRIAGLPITIYGSNFNTLSAVSFNGVAAASYRLVSPSTIVATVPSGSTAGPITVTNLAGSDSSTTFTPIRYTATDLTAGTSHACARLADGTARCWGLNSSGQLGDGTLVRAATSVEVYGLTSISQVSAGSSSTCAVRDSGVSGTVSCWGLNSSGQLGDGTVLRRLTPVAVVGVGGIGTLTGVSSLASGASHVCALLADSRVACWGANSNGQLGDGTTVSRTTPVVVTGIGGSGVLSNVVSVAARGSQTCALLSNGRVACWGANSNGQLGDGTLTRRSSPVLVAGVGGVGYLEGATSITVGGSHACAIVGSAPSSAIACWGANSARQLGDGTTYRRVVPITVLTAASSALFGATSLVAGSAFTCAVISGGVRCWGSDAVGQRGDGSAAFSVYPGFVSAIGGFGALSGVTAAAAGDTSGHALAGGRVVAWGSNTTAQLGDNTLTRRISPVAPLGF